MREFQGVYIKTIKGFASKLAPLRRHVPDVDHF